MSGPVLTPAEFAHQVEAWAAHMARLTEQYEALEALLGCEPESPLADAVWRVAQAYTEAVARLVGDETEFLSWFWLENDLGAKGMAAGINGEAQSPIRSAADLVALMLVIRS